MVRIPCHCYHTYFQTIESILKPSFIPVVRPSPLNFQTIESILKLIRVISRSETHHNFQTIESILKQASFAMGALGVM